LFGKKTEESCRLHGATAAAGNRMLLGMLLASLALITWHVWAYGPSARTVAAEGMSGPLPALVGSEIWDLLFNRKGIVAELWEVFPYFIAGVLIAGGLRTYKIAVKLQASLRKYGILSVVVASFVGIITPLCACGTLTTAISLLFAGFPLAPVMSLMITSPLLSPSTYLLTLNDLGPEWTVVRTVSAVIMGIFAGIVTHFASRRWQAAGDLFVEGAIVRGDFHDEDYPDERLKCGCRRQFGNRVAVRTGNKFLIFLAKSSEMLWTVGKYILVGVTVGAVVERYMPQEWIYWFFGQKGPFSIVLVTLGSVPMFLHQLSASSILYHIKSSLDGTLDHGAALAFMVGGPVTAVPTMVMFWTFFKKRVFFLYMFVCLAGTILMAYGFQFLLFVPGVDMGNPLLKGVGTLSGGASVVVGKTDPNVRMVMDPAGKGLIAVYSNDFESRGGVVFDGGRGRIDGASAGRHDNLKYLANVAGWLEQANTSAASRTILIYQPGLEQGRAEPVASTVVAALQAEGFTVRVADDIPRLNGSLLEGESQLWLLFGNGAAGRGLNDAELEAVSRFSAEGKGIFIVSGGAPGAASNANAVASRFGGTFSGSVEHDPDLPVSVGFRLFATAADFIGNILKLVNKA